MNALNHTLNKGCNVLLQPLIKYTTFSFYRKEGATLSYSSYGSGTNFAFAIVLFILLIIAGIGLVYLLRTLIWSGA